MLRPGATPAQRLKAFKIAAIIIGAVAILLGMQVEQLDINFMVGQAFAIAAASYFPLLFLSAWWPRMTMKGAATGMLGGGLLAFIISRVTPIPANVPLWSIVAALAASALTGVGFGMYPASRAARLDPIEALRYE